MVSWKRGIFCFRPWIFMPPRAAHRTPAEATEFALPSRAARSRMRAVPNRLFHFAPTLLLLSACAWLSTGTTNSARATELEPYLARTVEGLVAQMRDQRTPDIVRRRAMLRVV